MSPASQAPFFIEEVKKLGYDFFTGVPCSYLKGAFALLEKEPTGRYVPAVREDTALGFAAGAWLGGRQPMVLMQNSGLGLSANALTQLHNLYQIPALLVISWRGNQDADADAPEHRASGAVTRGLLETLRIPFEVIDSTHLTAQLQEMTDRMRSTRRPVVLLALPGVLE